MGKKNYNYEKSSKEFKSIFEDFKCACSNKFNFWSRRRCRPIIRPCGPFGITPGKCIVCGILVITLLFYGVGLYGLIIIALLLVLLQFV